MSDASAVDRVIDRARAQGLLPAHAPVPAGEHRPWPVLLLTAFGAWLSAVPLVVVVGALFGSMMRGAFGAFGIGVLLIVAAVVVLRARDVPLFVEQLAVPVLLVGGGALGMGLFRHVGMSGGALVLAMVALALTVVLRAAWLRALLGAAAAVLFSLGLPGPGWRAGRSGALEVGWLTCHVLLLCWLAAQYVLARRLRGHPAAAVESVGAGWGLALLCSFAAWSGMTFLAGGLFPGDVAADVVGVLGRRSREGAAWPVLQAASALLVLAGAALAAHRWPPLRHPALACAALVLAGLAALMPSLGATLLMLSLLATSGRSLLAVAAAASAVWTVGAFYYQLAWPLAQKAACLVAAGVLLGVLAWWFASVRAASGEALAARAGVSRTARTGVLVSLVAVLAVANFGIREKEALIREGRPVFVELAPVDPRSLMQGDYMALRFTMPRELTVHRSTLGPGRRPHAIAQIDARGVARLQRIDTGAALQPDQLRIELTPSGGGWILVTDAWHFAEGEGARWARARFGEFRVDAAGRALLVGLRGAQLEAL